MTEEEVVIKGRWGGTIDLDEESLAALTLDGLAFGVVMFTVKEMGATKMVKGHPHRTDVFDVKDMRVLTGNNREQAVLFLAERTQADGQLTIDGAIAEVKEPRSEEREEAIEALRGAARGGQWMTTDEIDEDDPLAEELAGEGIGQFTDQYDDVEGEIGSIYDYKRHAKPEREARAGAKVGKFQSDELPDDAPAVREVVGRVQGPRPRKDKALQRFMEQQ